MLAHFALSDRPPAAFTALQRNVKGFCLPDGRTKDPDMLRHKILPTLICISARTEISLHGVSCIVLAPVGVEMHETGDDK